jgi:molecular chaperone DnaJ
VKTEKKLEVKIPPGVDTGSRLRLKGEGEPGESGGPLGDLYVDIQIEPHEVFERQGDNIFCQVSLSFSQAALGARIEVPTLHGEETFEIPKGTQSGTLFRIKGGGMPRLMGYGRGDEVIQAVVRTPTKLSKRQKELLKELAEISGEDVENFKKGFWK